MDYSTFVQHVAQRAGLPGEAEATVAAKAVLHSLGECLSRTTAERLAEDLPDPLAGAVRGANHGQRIELPEWVKHVRYRAGTRTGVAIELSAAVCMGLAEVLPEHLIEALKEDLPAPIAQLLRPPPAIPSPPAHLDRRHRTLAEGEPGGAQPLYASRPETAQSQSVARSDNPHGDTKLSSAQGLTQEREAETLATAQK